MKVLNESELQKNIKEERLKRFLFNDTQIQ